MLNTNMAKPDYIRVTDFPKNKENPFMGDVLQEMTVKQKRKYLKTEDGKASMLVIQPETGEVAAQTAFYEIEEVDETQFIKIYSNFMGVTWDLSAAGKAVLTYCMTLLEPRNDKITVRVDKALQFLGYKTQKPLFKGIADLLAKNVIARTNYSDEFFINPTMMFNGDRVTFAKTFVKKKSNASKSDPNQMNLFDYKTNPSFAATRDEYHKIAKQAEQQDPTEQPE